jgi:CelD/BcsL family acetyltransferase involved in cellulose biosynthesis
MSRFAGHESRRDAPGPDAPPDLEGRVIRGIDEIRAIAPEWRALAEGIGNAFVTPEWFFAWHRHYGHLDAPYVVIIRDGSGRLCGVLPLVNRRFGPFRSLRFAGGSLGDRFEPAADPADRERVAAAAAAALHERRREWSALILDWVEDDDPWLDVLLGSKGLSRARVRTTPLPYLDLSGLSWEDYLASRSRNFRGQLGRRRRALERDHEAVFTRVADEADIARRAETLFTLHERRWEGRQASSLTASRRQKFLADFAGLALEAGWLRLWFLELGGTPVAGWYGWHIGDRYAYYQAGLDPDYAAYSAGFVLLARTLEDAFAETAREYDFLRGDEDYKSRFTDTSRQASTWVAAPRLHPIRAAVSTLVAGRAAARRLPAPLRNPLERLAKRDSGS